MVFSHEAMTACIILLLCIISAFVLPDLGQSCNPTGEEYWNSKYEIGYVGRFYGFWSHGCGYNRQSTDYRSSQCSGCSCDYARAIISCSADRGNVYVRTLGFFNTTIGKGYFHQNVAQITLVNLPTLQQVDPETFGDIYGLTHLTIHRTKIEQFPDLSNNTQLELLDLSQNQISFFPNRSYSIIPQSVTHVNLISNMISWIPPNLFSGTNIQFLSLSSNQIGPIIPAKRFFNMPVLQYISFDGNQITEISKGSLDFRNCSELRHLNLSNNLISKAQANSFFYTNRLQILEMHGNKLKEFGSSVFVNLPDILHIDLNHNLMEVLEKNAFKNLPQLQTLRLHNQNLWYLYPDSLHSPSELIEVFISSNRFSAFPHNVFEMRSWESVVTVHADNCELTDLHSYPDPIYHTRQWQRLRRDFVPFQGLNNVQTLFLHNNLIGNLRDDTFCQMPNLLTINLNGNLLTSQTIGSQTFVCVPRLQHLDMGSNRLQFVPEAFVGNHSLQLRDLILSRNQIAYVRSNDFANLTLLSHLHLTSNNIHVIERKAFPVSLIILYVGSNEFNFKQNDTFTNLTSLTHLYLDNNRIDNLPTNAFYGLTSLRLLDLRTNRIPYVPYKMLRDSPSITTLYLDSNEITHIEDGALAHHAWNGLWLSATNNWIVSLPHPQFSDFSNRSTTTVQLTSNSIERIQSYQFHNFIFSGIHGLALSHNKISVLESFAFVSVTSGDLFLDGNPLKEIRQYAFDSVALRYIYMRNAQTDTLVSCTFRGLSASRLYMENCNIENLETSVFCDVRISDLYMYSCRISGIYYPLFANGSSVNRLHLENNQIRFLADDAFDETAITTLQLQNNQLVALPLKFGATGLNTLQLTSNLIERLTPGAFHGLSSLQFLYLGNNRITNIPARVFDELGSLYRLVLSNNQIETIAAGGLSTGLGNLNELDLRGNQIKHLMSVSNLARLRWLYLDNNPDLKTFEFKSFNGVSDTLQTLGLSGVFVTCNCEMVRTLYFLEKRISGGNCENQGTSLANLLQSVNQSDYLYLCSGSNFTGHVSAERNLILSWARPAYLHYVLPNNSMTLVGLSLEEGVNCVCRNAVVVNETVSSSNVTLDMNETPDDDDFALSPNVGTMTANVTMSMHTNESSGMNLTEIRCGRSWNSSEECILSKIEYSVVCTSDSLVLSLTTSNTSVLIEDAELGTTYQCVVTLLFNDTESSPTQILWLDVPTLDTVCNVTKRLTLPVTYYDFSITHPDFGTLPITDPAQPYYIASPTSSWLADLDNPNSTTFQDWFRDVPGSNLIFNSQIGLETCSNDNETGRYYNASHYPLDGMGYQSESQRNCTGEFHNTGFTSAIRSAIVYNGNMGITIGGGEYMWLYINTILVAEYNKHANNLNISCIKLELHEREDGLFDLLRNLGVIVNEVCNVSSTTTQILDLDLEAGQIYHFALFHVERESCSSQFLLETTNISFTEPLADPTNLTNIDDLTTATPTVTTEATTFTEPTSTTVSPTNDSFNLNLTSNDTTGSTMLQPNIDLLGTVPENLEVGSYVLTFGLGRRNGSWRVEMSSDETDESFRLSVTNQPNLTSSSTFFVTGNERIVHKQNFIDCFALNDLPSVSTPSKSSTVYTDGSLCHIYLRKRLDFETLNSYVLNISIKNILTNESEHLLIKLKVTDVNDNCPIVTPGNVNLSLLHPPLSTSVPIVTLNATDHDSFDNSNVNYVQSSASQSVTKDITSIVVLEVIAYDGGFPPLGTSVTISVELKSVLDSGLAEFYLRLPGYYAVGYDCSLPVGFEDFRIPLSAFSASSENSTGVCGTTDFAYSARLNRETTYDGHDYRLSGAWVPAFNDSSPWIQVDFGNLLRLSSVAVQGTPEYMYWVTYYVISYSNDGTTWSYYVPNNPADFNATNCTTSNDEFVIDSSYSNSTTDCISLNNETQDHVNASLFIRGNDDPFSTSRVDLQPNIYARYVRLHPVSWISGVGLRMEMYGCSASDQIFQESLCHRCPPTYRCPGDGRKLPCGRCPDNGTLGTDTEVSVSDLEIYPLTCGRSPTEFSFGASQICDECPVGHICESGIATPCPLYTYSIGCNATTCSTCVPCPPGHACHSGILIPCHVGSFSVDGQTAMCYPCPSGTFNTIVKATSCKLCETGYYSYTGSQSCSACVEQEWSSHGNSHCQPCFGECPCQFVDSPCFPKVQCVNRLDSNSSFVFECKECPVGYTGDGINCTDINECENSSNPCWGEVSCVNTVGGFFCEHCPTGYHGDSYFGHGLEDTLPGQKCFDVDECSMNACDTLTTCSNTEGSFMCGRCPEGYTGTGESRCTLLTPCRLTSRRCDSNATCLAVNFNNGLCECPFGFAGPGIACGQDDDADGQPDYFISCGDNGDCAEDNCIGFPNSGQEDADGDRMGDACDKDDDNDFIPDVEDNCPLVSNYKTFGTQLDSDGDGYGDACDTCPFHAGQFRDTDGDGMGDGCDLDDDNDGLDDVVDPCPLDPVATNDTDGDGVGDACDNCVNVNNPDQSDGDQNGFGDACDDGADTDGDGIINIFDNCPTFPNPSQSDHDGDGLGDFCDLDIDDDSINNQLDYCPFLADSSASNDKPCQKDFDRDGVDDVIDHCPNDPTVSDTSLLPNIIVNLNFGPTEPSWQFFHEGKSVMQTPSAIPSMVIGQHSYGSMNFTGSVFVNQRHSLGNYIGFAFSYHSNRRFYVVLWRGDYDDGRTFSGLKGLHIKIVNSNTGPGSTLAQALWYTGDTTGETEVLYHDPNLVPWQAETPYLFHILHRTSIGLIRVLISYRGKTLIDSGPVYDTTYTGGRVGVFAFEQAHVIWSNLQVKCVKRENTALRLMQDMGYILLRNTTDYRFEDSFTIDAFINIDETSLNLTNPIICTVDGSTFCISVVESKLSVVYGAATNISSTIDILPGTWNHVAVRYDASSCQISLFINGTNSVTSFDVENIKWEAFVGNQSISLAIGWDGANHYQGLVDDIRIYDRALSDVQLTDYSSQTGLLRQTDQKILTGHYDMNYHDSSSLVLKDRSLYNNFGTLIGKATFVHSTADVARYEITN